MTGRKSLFPLKLWAKILMLLCDCQVIILSLCKCSHLWGNLAWAGNNSKVFINFNGNRISLLLLLFGFFMDKLLEMIWIQLVIFTTEWSIKIDRYLPVHSRQLKVISVTKKILSDYIRGCKFNQNNHNSLEQTSPMLQNTYSVQDFYVALWTSFSNAWLFSLGTDFPPLF